MKRIWGMSVAALGLGLAAACSQGAPSDSFGSWPPPGPPAPSTEGDATFGVNTDGADGSCCLAQSGPGCDDQFVESCVCADAPGCCSDTWTESCAALVEDLGCGMCGGPPDAGDDADGTGPPPAGQDCCVVGASPGCNDATVESCVCSEIAFCCDSGWEEVCAAAVEALGCGHCGGGLDTGGPPPGDTGDSGGPPPPPPGGGDCCSNNGTPGCDDAAVEGCVCMQDAYCCDTAWDQVCVDQVDSFGCGSCGGMPPPGASTCCSEQPTPGCDDPFVEACVCLFDDFCCTTQWDAACAQFVELFGCGSCS